MVEFLTIKSDQEEDLIESVLSEDKVVLSQLDPFPVIPPKLFGSMLHDDNIRSPFIISKSNVQAQLFMNKIKSKGIYNILFVIGESGVGKTHFLEYNIQKLLLKGAGVFYIKAIDLIGLLRKYFSDDGSFDFINHVKYIFIDDIQMLNNESYVSFFNSFFNLLDLWLKTKKVIVSSDVPHTFLRIFPERIVNRLASGVVAGIDFPDTLLKRAFIEHFCEANHFEVLLEHKDVYEFLLSKRTIREIKAILKQYLLMYEIHGSISKDFIKSAYFFQSRVVLSDPKKEIDAIKALLTEFYGFAKPVATKRKSRLEALIDSIVFYVYSENNPSAIRYVRKQLKIQQKHDRHYFRKGENAYNSLPEELKKAIQRIVKK